MDLFSLTIRQLRDLYESRRISRREAVAGYLDRISSRDRDIRAYLRVNERAADEAAGLDAKAARGEPLGPLAGIPVALKDNLSTRDIPTTCASRILEGYVPVFDATVVERLKAAGAVVLGKTNMDEFAFGSSTENSAFGATRNPRDTARVPGGSSGGSAAAVAAGLCCGALGSDTGGSIRQPAAFCGVVGLKPTYGLVSRYGLVAFASSLDQIGPLARDVRDAAILLDATAGRDRRDSTSVERPAPAFERSLSPDVRGLRVGLPREYFGSGIAPEVEEPVRRAVESLAARGAEVREISLPHTEFGIAVYYIIATAEASANLARFDGVRYGRRAADPRDMLDLYMRSRGEGFGDEVKRRVMLGTYVLSSGYYDAYYLRAQKVRTLIARDFTAAFETVDVIATPTSPEPAFPAGAKTADPLSMYLSDIFTVNVNLAGLPAISVPAVPAGKGLPAGLQIIGPAFGEDRVLGAALAVEEAVGGGIA